MAYIMFKTLRKISKLSGFIYKTRLAVVLESVVIGLLVGLIISVFRLILGAAEARRITLYVLFRERPILILPAVLVLALAGLFLGWAIKTKPMIRGSGIPQIEGALNRLMILDCLRELPLKIITGIMGLAAGLSLGREGPSIQIGAYTGQGVLSVMRRPHRERVFLIASASAAGLAAAFNAPLAGVLFVLEELRASFSPLLLACAMAASMTADAVASSFFGQGPIFDFTYIKVLPLVQLPWVVLLGVLCALLGDIFKKSLYLAQDGYEKCKIPIAFRPLFPLLVSIPLGLFLFDITGGGHTLIESLSLTERTLGTLALLLGGRILFTALCYGSGTSGGIFLPLLACGALTGDGLAKLLGGMGFVPADQHLNYLILGMAGFFAAVVKAPVTGIVLILEMTANFNHLGSLVLVSLSAFVCSELINSRPVYSVLLERILKGQKKAQP
jgi:H+/Cl- antiporter ClcA